MAEPTNPLFEEEKEFLERKKLEYERALRGDVEHLKDQTINVGKLALAGAGVVGGIWLLAKAFRGRKARPADKRTKAGKKPKAKGQPAEDQDSDFASGQASGSQRFGEDEEFDQPGDSYFGADDEPSAGYDDDQADDNDLKDYPSFPAHSSRQHGGGDDAALSEGFYFNDDDDDHFGYSQPTNSEPAADQAPAEDRRFHHPELSHPSANLPYDDSRHLPGSTAFQDLTPAQELAAASPQARKNLLGQTLLHFAQSDTGRLMLGQAAAAGLALLGKVVKDRMPADSTETGKTSDLAASTSPTTVAGPHSPVSDADHPDAAAITAHPTDATPAR